MLESCGQSVALLLEDLMKIRLVGLVAEVCP